MILEAILVVAFALILDLFVGDPKNKFHPTSWIGIFIAKIVPILKNNSPTLEKIGGIILVILVSSVVGIILGLLYTGIQVITVEPLAIILSVTAGVLLLKSTIAIRGMEKHAMAVMDSIEKNDLASARTNLSMIVKRNTKNLDKNHLLSGTLESISENTVDGITGPLFYFSFFGIHGAFIYRVINTLDSMIGYKTSIFRNVGWFSANCDKVLNYIPARITSLLMIIGAMILGNDWKKSFHIMKRDARKTQSPNAGYPIAALAGALDARLEKINHYSVGEGDIELSKSHLKSAIALMKVTSILFSVIFTIPVMVILYYLGWWIHA
jgi:adenosylcobinamide-phosphate synthase